MPSPEKFSDTWRELYPPPKEGAQTNSTWGDPPPYQLWPQKKNFSINDLLDKNSSNPYRNAATYDYIKSIGVGSAPEGENPNLPSQTANPDMQRLGSEGFDRPYPKEPSTSFRNYLADVLWQGNQKHKDSNLPVQKDSNFHRSLLAGLYENNPKYPGMFGGRSPVEVGLTGLAMTPGIGWPAALGALAIPAGLEFSDQYISGDRSGMWRSIGGLAGVPLGFAAGTAAKNAYTGLRSLYSKPSAQTPSIKETPTAVPQIPMAKSPGVFSRGMSNSRTAGEQGIGGRALSPQGDASERQQTLMDDDLLNARLRAEHGNVPNISKYPYLSTDKKLSGNIEQYVKALQKRKSWEEDWNQNFNQLFPTPRYGSTNQNW